MSGARFCQISLDLAALTHNLNQVKRLAPHSKVLAMVKSNAYGHGALSCLPALKNADGFGVAFLQEAKALLTANPNQPVVVMEGAFSEAEWLEFGRASMHGTPGNIEACVCNAEQLNWAVTHPIGGRVWLKLNTGMNRLGFKPVHAKAAYHALTQAGYEVVLMTHFANADTQNHPMNQQQLELFFAVQASTGATQHSVANSAATCSKLLPNATWVRPGIMLYGGSPLNRVSAHELGLQAVMRFESKIMELVEVAAGESVGYGSEFTASKPMSVAVVSVGYGDGYPRRASGCFVSVQGVRCAVVGRVSMDMITVDVSHLNQPKVGDLVELWGTQIPIDEVAAHAGTISYELMCQVTARPERITLS